MTLKKSSESGFTLIELMIVVAVMGVLAAVAYPSFIDQIQKARRVDAMNVLTRCATQQERSYTVNNTYVLTGLCGNLVSGSYLSDDGYYTIAVTNPDSCTTTVGGTTRQDCFSATATAVAGKSQANDADCNTFTLTHTGARSSKNSASADSTAKCWRD